MSDTKDTVKYPLSAIMGKDENRIEALERELAEVKEQLRLCNVDQFTTAAELAEAVEKERERCALVCERVSIPYENTSSEAAAAIRKGE